MPNVDDKVEDLEEDTVMYDVDPTSTFPLTYFLYTRVQEEHENLEDELDELEQMIRDFEELRGSKKAQQISLHIKDSKISIYQNYKPKYPKLATMLPLLQMNEKFKWPDF